MTNILRLMQILRCRLFSDGETDLLTASRSNGDVLPLIQASIWSKKKELGGQLIVHFETLDADTIKKQKHDYYWRVVSMYRNSNYQFKDLYSFGV